MHISQYSTAAHGGASLNVRIQQYLNLVCHPLWCLLRGPGPPAAFVSASLPGDAAANEVDLQLWPLVAASLQGQHDQISEENTSLSLSYQKVRSI